MKQTKIYLAALLITLILFGCDNKSPTETDVQAPEDWSNSSIDKKGSNSIISIALARVDVPRDFVPDLADDFVTIHGVVSSPNFWDPSTGAVHHFIQGHSAGIQFFAYPKYYPDLEVSPVLNMGDEVVVRGRIVHWMGGTIIRLESDNDIQILRKKKLHKPKRIHTTNLADLVGEKIEGQLATLKKVRLMDGDQFPEEGNYGLIRVIDSKGNVAEVFIDNETDIDGSATPSGWFNLTGVVNQFTDDIPADNRYHLLPRGRFDID